MALHAIHASADFDYGIHAGATAGGSRDGVTKNCLLDSSSLRLCTGI